jgi:hypothetical protein
LMNWSCQEPVEGQPAPPGCMEQWPPPALWVAWGTGVALSSAVQFRRGQSHGRWEPGMLKCLGALR